MCCFFYGLRTLDHAVCRIRTKVVVAKVLEPLATAIKGIECGVSHKILLHARKLRLIRASLPETGPGTWVERNRMSFFPTSIPRHTGRVDDTAIRPSRTERNSGIARAEHALSENNSDVPSRMILELVGTISCILKPVRTAGGYTRGSNDWRGRGHWFTLSALFDRGPLKAERSCVTTASRHAPP